MKSLIAILFLINCLAFFMLQHIQKQSELLNEKSGYQQDTPLVSPQQIILLSELSSDQLEALYPKPVTQVQLEAEQAFEDPASELVDSIVNDELVDIQSEKALSETLSNDP